MIPELFGDLGVSILTLSQTASSYPAWDYNSPLVVDMREFGDSLKIIRADAG
jgi:hypothetical protein